VPGPTPYLTLPGTARAALSFYAEVFGGTTELHTFADFGREDGPPAAIAHGLLKGGPVRLYASDAGSGGRTFNAEGLMLSLLGTAPPETLRAWFDRLAAGGRIVQELEERAWGASDGQVIDRFGVHWLIGFEPGA
jgi:PhnB protein